MWLSMGMNQKGAEKTLEAVQQLHEELYEWTKQL